MGNPTEKPQKATEKPAGKVLTEADVERARIQAREEGIQAERARITEINLICKHHNIEGMANSLIETGTQIEAAKHLILDAMVTRSESYDIISRHGHSPQKESGSELSLSKIYGKE